MQFTQSELRVNLIERQFLEKLETVLFYTEKTL